MRKTHFTAGAQWPIYQDTETGDKQMTKAYDIEIPSCADTAVSGVALLIADTIRGHRWDMACDKAGRPLAITRDGKPYPSLPVLLRPMHAFAVRFLGGAA